jgi:hypothetical protein
VADAVIEAPVSIGKSNGLFHRRRAPTLGLFARTLELVHERKQHVLVGRIITL